MVENKCVRFQVSQARMAVLRQVVLSAAALSLFGLFICSSFVTHQSSLLFGQQAQAQQGQPLSALNAKYVNGVAPGYWPMAGTGLTVNVGAGTALCGYPPAPVNYAGGTLALTASMTNYVYLEPLSSCAPASNVSGFGVGQIPIAVVVTNASTIITLSDVRSWFAPNLSMDSTGRSILKGMNGTYFADQLGDKSTSGIASSISVCGSSTPCRVVVPGTYPTTETVPGSGWQGFAPGGTTSGSVQVQDYRYGDYQIAINPQGMGTGHRAWHYWNDNQYTAPTTGYWSHSAFQLNMSAMDGGMLYENNAVGAYGKNDYTALEAAVSKYTPSSDSVVTATCNDYSPGDCVPLYGTTYFYGGHNTQGEEGAEAVDLWLLQGTGAYQATIGSGGTTGSTSLSLTNTVGEGTQGAGRYLIDTTPGKTIAAGSISAVSNNTGGTPVTFTGTGTSWPVSTVNTTTTQAITAPGVQTVIVASTSGITANTTVLLICDGTEPETVIPTAVGTGSITANFKYPRASGAIVAAGGLTGYYLELTADTVSSSVTGGTTLRQTFPVLYSTSTTSLAAGIIEQGSFQAFVPTDATAWANSSGNNGYVLYPGATVLSVQANGLVGDTFALMPNTEAWTNGDTVELPRHPAGFSRLGSWLMQNWFPWPGNQGPLLEYNGVHGYYTTGLTLGNNTPLTRYSGNGGNLAAPRYAIQVGGPWQNALALTTPLPGAVGISIALPAWGSGTTMYPVQVSNSAGSNDVLAYNQSSALWSLTASSRSASYSFGGVSFSIPAHFGGSSADLTGSVTITSGTSATVLFSMAYTSVPKCVVTPTSDPSSIGAYWVTATTTAMTVNEHTLGTMTFNYVCVGI